MNLFSPVCGVMHVFDSSTQLLPTLEEDDPSNLFQTRTTLSQEPVTSR